MPFGYTGKILHVDLTRHTTEIEEPGDVFYRSYLGGRGIGYHYLMRDMPARVDALAPENVLTLRDRGHDRRADRRLLPLHRRGQVPAHGRGGRVRGRRVLRPRAQAGRVRRGGLPRPLRAPGLPVGDRGPRRDPRRPRDRRSGHARGRGRHPGRARQRQDPGRPDRAGRHAPGALRQRDQQPRPLQRPQRVRGGHGLEEPAGRGRARHRRDRVPRPRVPAQDRHRVRQDLPQQPGRRRALRLRHHGLSRAALGRRRAAGRQLPSERARGRLGARGRDLHPAAAQEAQGLPRLPDHVQARHRPGRPGLRRRLALRRARVRDDRRARQQPEHPRLEGRGQGQRDLQPLLHGHHLGRHDDRLRLRVLRKGRHHRRPTPAESSSSWATRA